MGKNAKEEKAKFEAKFSKFKKEGKFDFLDNKNLSDDEQEALFDSMLKEFSEADVDMETTNEESAEQVERLEKLKAAGKCKLPDDWKKMSVGKQCEYLNDLLREILEYDDDYDISVTLQCSSKHTYAFVQFTNEGCSCDSEPDYVRCHLVRRNTNITLADLPEPFQEWAKDYYGEADADKETVAVELCSGGKTISKALEELFYRIILLFYGYECLYFRGAYTDYCMENDDDDDGFDFGDDDEEDNDEEETDLLKR